MHAILAARELAAPEARLTGEHPPSGSVRAPSTRILPSTSGALAVGIGRDNIRHVPADDEFRMRPDALEAMIKQDLAAGQEAVLRGRDLGTTSTPSVDPLTAIGAIARRYELWLHIDAAYGGPAALLEEHRHILDGAALADSLVINPHKWLFTPVDLSILYTRRPEIMRRALSLEKTPAYLVTAPSRTAPLNFSEYSLALGRRFRSLKLWFVLRYYGREGIARGFCASTCVWPQSLTEEISADPRFELSAPMLFLAGVFPLPRIGRRESRSARTHQRQRQDVSVRHRAAREIRIASGDRQRRHHGRGYSRDLGTDQVVSASERPDLPPQGLQSVLTCGEIPPRGRFSRCAARNSPRLCERVARPRRRSFWLPAPASRHPRARRSFQLLQTLRRNLQEQPQHAADQVRDPAASAVGQIRSTPPAFAHRNLAGSATLRCFSIVATRCAGCTGFEM